MPAGQRLQTGKRATILEPRVAGAEYSPIKGLHRELRSCLACAMVGVGAGRQTTGVVATSEWARSIADSKGLFGRSVGSLGVRCRRDSAGADERDRSVWLRRREHDIDVSP